MSEKQVEHVSLANVNVAGAFQFQRKVFKGLGIGMMVLGGLLSLTIIGAIMGIPLIIMGLAVYFLVPKFFQSMQKAVTTAPNPSSDS